MRTMKNERILITGGAGFIGSEVVRQAAARGAEIIVVDNLVNGRRENLQGLPVEQVRLEECDIRNAARMAELMRGVDAVYHLACLGVRHSIHAPEENHEVNATGTLQLLFAAQKNKVKRFVYVSSSEIYGTAKWVPMTEEHPAYPKTIYGASKLAGECYTRAFFDTYKLPTVVIRPFNTFGPRCHHEGDSGEVIPKFMLRSMAGIPMMIFGDGTQTRDFTYVSDTAQGILLAGEAEASIGQTINLGSGREMTINDLTESIARATGRARLVGHNDPRPGDVLRLCADISRARELCGYNPTVPFETGLAQLKAWYQSLDTPVETLLEQEFVENWVSENCLVGN